MTIELVLRMSAESPLCGKEHFEQLERIFAGELNVPRGRPCLIGQMDE